MTAVPTPPPPPPPPLDLQRIRTVEILEEEIGRGVLGLLDERVLAWYEAAALLRVAARMLRRPPADRAEPLFARAAQLAADAR